MPLSPLHAPATPRYFFPALVYAYFVSPLDALLSLCIPRDEAMKLIVASWHAGHLESILTEQNGGRCVAAIPLADQRWAACLAFPDKASTCLAATERISLTLSLRGKKSLIGVYSHRALSEPECSINSAKIAPL